MILKFKLKIFNENLLLWTRMLIANKLILVIFFRNKKVSSKINKWEEYFSKFLEKENFNKNKTKLRRYDKLINLNVNNLSIRL